MTQFFLNKWWRFQWGGNMKIKICDHIIFIWWTAGVFTLYTRQARKYGNGYFSAMFYWSSSWWNIWIACRMPCFGVKAFGVKHKEVAIRIIDFLARARPLALQIACDIFVSQTICVKLPHMHHKLCGEPIFYPDHQAWLQSKQDILSLRSQWLDDVVLLSCMIHISNRMNPNISDIFFENRKHSWSSQNDTAKHTITLKCNCRDTLSYS